MQHKGASDTRRPGNVIYAYGQTISEASAPAPSAVALTLDSDLFSYLRYYLDSCLDQVRREIRREQRAE